MFIKQLQPVQKTFVMSSFTFADSVMDHMMDNRLDCLRVKLDDCVGYFGLFQEVDESGDPIGEEMVGRYFRYGIGRHGGVKTPYKFDRNSLEEVEKEFGCSAGFLSDSDDWDGEETKEEATARNFRV